MKAIGAAVVGLVVCLGARAGRAEALRPAEVPAEAKWVVHLDVDAMKGSETGKIIEREVLRERRGMTEMEKRMGMRVPQDVHGVTMWGREFSGENGVVLLRADLDVEKFKEVLQTAPNFESVKYNTREVYTWRDKRKQLYAAIVPPGLAVVSQSPENLLFALDLLDGKAEAMTDRSPLLAGFVPGVMAYVSGTGLAAMRKPGAPQGRGLAAAEAGWIALAEQGADMVGMAAVKTSSPEAAMQAKVMLEGLKMMVGLAALDENAPQRTKLQATALANLGVAADDRSLTAEWKIPLTTLPEFLKLMKWTARQEAAETK